MYRKNKKSKREKQQPKTESYHTSQETWGKKEPPGTPKTNAKIGQFQQSPSIPLSETQDIKTKKTRGKIRRLSGFSVFLRKNRKKLNRRFRNMTTATEEAARMWRELPEAKKKLYLKMAENKNSVKINEEFQETYPFGYDVLQPNERTQKEKHSRGKVQKLRQNECTGCCETKVTIVGLILWYSASMLCR